ncbi:MAG: SPOR domain-containing protein [Steroidobacteraceae bacterium]
MSLRTTFLLLLFVNLAFFGWAALIDVPAEPPPSDSISKLPQLKLLSEVRAKGSSPGPAGAASSSASSSGAPAVENGASGRSASAADRSDGAAGSAVSPPTGAVSPEPAAAGAAAIRAEPTAAAGGSRRCITIGPFTDPERAREAADVLRGRGFAPHGRTAANLPPQGYWVFIGGLKSAAEETTILHRLERNGISDAKAMPASDAGRRVSVGLFNARDGAARRARAVQRLGLDAQVEPRPAEVAHWEDVDLDSSGQSLPAEGLLSLEEPGSRLEIKECPARAQGAGSAPRPLAAAGHPRPG